MSRPLVVPFPAVSDPIDASADPTLVGGKGLSLIRMSALRLPVPPGAVLTAAFFDPWVQQMTSSEAWRKPADCPVDRRPEISASLKGLCGDLAFSQAQRDALRSCLAGLGAGHLFAVRSSSPEEDLASASFAGGYETVLGVAFDGLEDALRRIFASCFDERVFIYKETQGFDPFAIRFAGVVQQQLASEVSGVGFSLNPQTNDYDEALIEGNWGLGESVVSGAVSPDRWVVDKVDRRVVEHELGGKRASIWLGEDGGTFEKEGFRSDEPCLDDERILKLAELIKKVEAVYGRPMDIEWAFAGGRLFLLQARPITTYVPLAPEMTTRPGERRRLYADAALSKGMTTNEPLSVLELDYGKDLLDGYLKKHFGMDGSPKGSVVFFAGSRLYMNLSQMLWLANPEKLAKASEPNDRLMAEIQAGIDADRYRAGERPSWLSLSNILPALRLMWQTRALVWNSLRPLWATTEKIHREYVQKATAFERALIEDVDYEQPYGQMLETWSGVTHRHVFFVVGPSLAAALFALELVSRLGRKKEDLRPLTERLQKGFEGNVVVEMGIALHALAKQLAPSDFDDLQQLADRIRSRSMPEEFLSSWDRFMARYGWRGPNEMDQASPRYADDPVLALRQMSYMVGSAFDPEEVHRQNVQGRESAFAELLARSGPFRRWWLRRMYRVIERFAGVRDTPKHHLVLFNYVLRKRALLEGHRLTEQGRLDSPEQIFDLSAEDIQRAAQEPSLDLRAIRRERVKFFEQLKSQVKQFPQVIDSRGRILRPPVKEQRPGEWTGTAVSAGIARGPVKVLSRPDEKSVDAGDILVAYTTDPGWTPLFVNAAAVVLEVGGILQHGAVVAREYGKPCVVGIDRVTSRFKDGQMVEVDGHTGVLKLLDDLDVGGES